MSLDPALRARIESLLAIQPRRAVHEGRTARAAMRLLGQGGRRAGRARRRLRPRRRAGRPGDPRRHQGIRRVADDPAALHRRRAGRRQRHHRADGQLRRTAHRARPARAGPHARRASPSPPAAAQMLRDAVANAGDGYALQVEVDARFNAKLQLAPVDANAIAVETDGLRAQFDLASARRARRHDDRLGRRRARPRPGRSTTPTRRRRCSALSPVEARRARRRRHAEAGRRAPGRGARAGHGQRAVLDASTTMRSRSWKRCRRTPRSRSCATTASAARRRPSISAAWASATCSTSKAASKPGPTWPTRTWRVTELMPR